MKAPSKVVAHWSNDFADGMAYVASSRSERMKDYYIAGHFDVKQIKCNLDALAETNRLQKIFDDSEKEQRDQRKNVWRISYLNVRSLKSSNGHREDVKSDNFIMDTDLFGLGETWLQQDNKVNFVGFSGYFANFGNGKGVAGYSKISLVSQPEVASSETYSAIFFKTEYFHIIFLYLSSTYSKDSLFALLETWIEKDKPTAVIGDVNENLLKMKKSNFTKMMRSHGFDQLIKEPTCLTGSLIDHLYVNDAMKAKGISTAIDAAYYSDHDIISLDINKQ